MYDLMLLAIIVLPLAAVHLAGHFLTHGFDQLAPAQQAVRKQRANWIVSLGMMVQFLAPSSWLSNGRTRCRSSSKSGPPLFPL